jgi:uncharacterized Fe-S cluster-containing radical SAM superfamily enzyme
VKKLTAFFFGNGVPVSTAADLYHFCNDHMHLHIRCDMHDLYVTWQRHMCVIHIYEYYNISKHKFMWINNAVMDQNEEVLPVVTSMDFGVDNMGYGPFIADRLILVRGGVKCECHCMFCTNKTLS